MLRKIADDLERFDASIDVIDHTQAKTAIEAALGTARVLLGAMTVEVFYLTKKQIDEVRDGTQYPKIIPHFIRFAADLDPEDPDALDKRVRDEYSPNDYGVWSWSYENNKEVWVEDRWIEYIDENNKIKRSRQREPVAMEHRVAMENMAVMEREDKKLDREHNIFWNSVNAAIVIPFSYKLGATFIRNDTTNELISHQANGFISFEFKQPKRYDHRQLTQLLRIRESVADLIWKSHAWNDSLNGTNHAVEKFREECSETSKNFPSVKTGLCSFEREGYESLMTLISTVFSNNRIAIQTYDGRLDELGLLETGGYIASRIRKVHFAVFDFTEKNLGTDMLLSIIFADKKPCLILHENAEMMRHPLITELERAAKTEQETNQLLDLWFYERSPSGEEYLFFKSSNGERREWSEVFRHFLKNVEKISEPFRTASDGHHLEKN